MKKLVYIFIALMLSTTIFAQVPQGFNYQAVARDGDNAVLASTNLDIKIGYFKVAKLGL